MGSAISVRAFSKVFQPSVFGPKVTAAHSIDLEVPEGEIFGFLGPNGAGKTTTIKALLGLIRPTKGELKVLGRPPSELAWRRRIGYAAEHPVFPPYLSALEMVTWFAQLGGARKRDATKNAHEALELVGLGGREKQRLKTYSKGMLQRAALAQAVVGRPELLILDEPMTGLDPIGRRDVRELVLEMKRRGSTVFYSTHILPDIEATCDRVAIIAKGRTLAADVLDNLLKGGEGKWEVTLDKPFEFEGAVAVTDPIAGWPIYSFDEQGAAARFVQQAQNEGRELRQFNQVRQDLEQIFLKSLGSTPS